MLPLDLNNIQGNIVLGYNMPVVRHFVLRVGNAGTARSFLGKLTGGDSSRELQVTTAAPWTTKPDYTLNVGITAAGLSALGLPQTALNSFPEAFREGAPARAATVGDVGQNAPDNWLPGLRPEAGGGAAPVHLLLSLHAKTHTALEEWTQRLRDQFARGEALEEIAVQEGVDLPESRVHFGFIDGLSQPHIEGGPRPRSAGLVPAVPAGEFLLGYESQYPGYTYSVPQPNALGQDGTFFAYRILQQDVNAFEAYLSTEETTTGLSRELIAAKICGRWRSGVPLALSPDTDSPLPPLPHEQLNQFDYVPTAAHPEIFNDMQGVRCPVGAHIRRAHPRSQPVIGNAGHLRRIIRRGIPYGQVYRPDQPDNIERGLLLQVICVSLEDQFEFLMNEWINGVIFTPGVKGMDPLIGSNGTASGRLEIPQAGCPAVMLEGFQQFVTTRGGAYCFVPSVAGLRYLASL